MKHCYHYVAEIYSKERELANKKAGMLVMSADLTPDQVFKDLLKVIQEEDSASSVLITRFSRV